MNVNGLEITDVIIFPVRDKNLPADSELRAFAKMVINDQFIINGIRIFEGRNGPYIKFPQELNEKEGKGYEICFPITADLRNYMRDRVLSQYSICMLMREEDTQAELDSIPEKPFEKLVQIEMDMSNDAEQTTIFDDEGE